MSGREAHLRTSGSCCTHQDVLWLVSHDRNVLSQGRGKVKHLEVRQLWLQSHIDCYWKCGLFQSASSDELGRYTYPGARRMESSRLPRRRANLLEIDSHSMFMARMQWARHRLPPIEEC